MRITTLFRTITQGLVFGSLLLLTPLAAGAQDFPYMDEPGWVFDQPESQGMGPDPGASYDTGGWYPVVAEAAAYYGISADWLYNTMMCESGGDPYAQGAHGEYGIMQVKLWLWPEAGTDPVQQIWFAASMFASGQSSHWLCA